MARVAKQSVYKRGPEQLFVADIMQMVVATLHTEIEIAGDAGDAVNTIFFQV